MCGINSSNSRYVEYIASILKSFWHPAMSMLTILCASRSPNSPKIMSFDGRKAKDADFKQVARDDPCKTAKNKGVEEGGPRADWIDFNVHKLAILSQGVLATDSSEIHKFFSHTQHLLREINFGYLCDVMERRIRKVDYEEVGAMMNLHQQLVSLAGFTFDNVDKLVRALQSEPEVIGAKPTCLTNRGAILVLTAGSTISAIERLSPLVKPLLACVEPTPGLTQLRPAIS